MAQTDARDGCHKQTQPWIKLIRQTSENSGNNLRKENGPQWPVLTIATWKLPDSAEYQNGDEHRAGDGQRRAVRVNRFGRVWARSAFN